MKMIDKYGLKISSTMFEFINNEAIPDTNVDIQEFWSKFSNVVHELSPTNKGLIQKREKIQKNIDEWHKSNKGKEFNKDDYIKFLKSIGYMVKEEDDFLIKTSNVDNEISSNWVYISSSKLIGYLFGWKIENEFHINNIATHRNFRRLGVAKKMIDNIVTNLLPKKIFLEVSNFNNSAVMLYENLGFKKNGIRKRYYSDNSDAIMYKMDIK